MVIDMREQELEDANHDVERGFVLCNLCGHYTHIHTEIKILKEFFSKGVDKSCDECCTGDADTVGYCGIVIEW